MDIKISIDVTYVDKAKELKEAEETAEKARLAKEEELRAKKEKEKAEELIAEKIRAEEEKNVSFTWNCKKTKSKQTKTVNPDPVIYPLPETKIKKINQNYTFSFEFNEDMRFPIKV